MGEAAVRSRDSRTAQPTSPVTLSEAIKIQYTVQVQLGTFVGGALDVNAASPRRYFFEVLQRYAQDALQRERLEHFASPEGREDLTLYNQSEGQRQFFI